MLCKSLVVLSFALLSMPAIASAQEEGEGGGCFVCDDWQRSSGEWRHNDYNWFNANDSHGGQGGYHAPASNPYSCFTHDDYTGSGGGGGPSDALLAEAVAAGDVEFVTGALLLNPSIRLNVERFAVQVFGVSEQVVMHLPLDARTYERVSETLGNAMLYSSSRTAASGSNGFTFFRSSRD